MTETSICSRSHALRGNACMDAPRPAMNQTFVVSGMRSRFPETR
jgi:hypothetical protein